MSKEKKEKQKEESAQLKAEIKQLREHLMGLQQTIRAKGLPIIDLVESWASAGKGTLINEADIVRRELGDLLNDFIWQIFPGYGIPGDPHDVIQFNGF